MKWNKIARREKSASGLQLFWNRFIPCSCVCSVRWSCVLCLCSDFVSDLWVFHDFRTFWDGFSRNFGWKLDFRYKMCMKDFLCVILREMYEVTYRTMGPTDTVLLFVSLTSATRFEKRFILQVIKQECS